MTTPIPTTPLPSGVRVPVLGQGTWHMGEDPRRRANEMAALRAGLDLGLSLLDTAEMYGDGATEELVAEVVAGRRAEVFLVSKVLPGNASHQGVLRACERSLRRLRTDHLDLYLLHWRGRTPLEDTLAAFEDLQRAGLILQWGVSNFGPADLQELAALPGGKAAATNQVLYNLTRRGVEYDLLPWCRERGVPVMAYSPVEQGRLLGHPMLEQIARGHGATPAQVALAWLLRQDGIIAIPKAGTTAHVQDNRAALDVRLTEDDLAALDRAFPPPTRATPLEML